MAALAPESNVGAPLVSGVDVSVIVRVVLTHSEEHLWLLVKNRLVGHVSLHVLVELDFVLYLAFNMRSTSLTTSAGAIMRLLANLAFTLFAFLEGFMLLIVHLQRLIVPGVHIFILHVRLVLLHGPLARTHRAVADCSATLMLVRGSRHPGSIAFKSLGPSQNELFLPIHSDAGALLVATILIPCHLILIWWASVAHRNVRVSS